MKVNEITDNILLDLCNGYDYELVKLKMFKDSAISYVKNYCKLTDEQINTNDDITLVVIALVQHFNTMDGMTSDNKDTNIIIDNILKMYDRNW